MRRRRGLGVEPANGPLVEPQGGCDHIGANGRSCDVDGGALRLHRDVRAAGDVGQAECGGGCVVQIVPARHGGARGEALTGVDLIGALQQLPGIRPDSPPHTD